MERKTASGTTILRQGAWASKIGYTNKGSLRRYFWLDENFEELLWGQFKHDDDSLRIHLRDVVAVAFGPSTTTFSRLKEDSIGFYPWCCLSLIFLGRTLDLAMEEDVADKWVLSLQALCSHTAQIDRQTLLREKVWMKIVYEAISNGRTLPEHFRFTITSCFSELRAGRPRRSSPSLESTPRDLLRSIRTMQTDLSDLRSSVALLVNKEFIHLSQLLTRIPAMAAKVDSSANRYASELELMRKERRDLLNELIELKGNIRVFARIRPLIGTDTHRTKPDGLPLLLPSDDRILVYSDKDMARKPVYFDAVIPPSVNQTLLFSELAQLVDAAVDGYNVCVLAYGATNSGKTYTMEGTSSNPGIIEFALERIFRLNQFISGGSPNETNNESSVSLAAVQVYNEAVFDSFNGMNEVPLKLSTDGEGFDVIDITKVKTTTLVEARRAIAQASAVRTTSSTKINCLSSRSHSIVTVYVDSIKYNIHGKLSLVDLAGSENVGKSGATGSTLRETQYINKSLSALGDVIHTLISGKGNPQKYIPFRNSKLTMLLKDSLRGNSKSLMIVHVSPSDTDLVESLNTLSFGQRVRMVEVGRPYRNQ